MLVLLAGCPKIAQQFENSVFGYPGQTHSRPDGITLDKGGHDLGLALPRQPVHTEQTTCPGSRIKGKWRDYIKKTGG